MRVLRLSPALAATAVLCIGMAATLAQADPAGKWRVKFDGYTGNDGTIVLRVTPEGGTAVDVETRITAKTSDSGVAKAMRDSLKASLGEGYKIETDDGQDVVVGKSGDTPKFDVTLVSSSLLGLSIGIKRE